MLGLGLGVDRGGFVPSALLDVYGGAVAAYSLRKLRNNYTGAAIRVRESATNTEADIGFTSSGVLDTAALLAHTGANNGFVVTWYDQSGSNNATQASAANQPQIVSSGSVILENGMAAIDFDGINDHLATSTAYDTQSTGTHFYLASSTGTNNRVIDTRGTGSTGVVIGWHHKFSNPNIANDTATLDDGVGNDITIRGVNRSGQKLVSAELSLTQLKEYTNSVLEDTQTGTLTSFDSGNPLYIGANVNGANTQLFGGTMQEIVLYNSDQSANRTAIESNINAHYNIYP